MSDTSIWNFLTFLPLAMGLMLSPDSLVILGNSVGCLGPAFFGIATMMALGMAGEPETEAYARTGLYFWLLTQAVVPISVIIVQRRSPRRAHAISTVIQIIGSIAFFLVVFGLVFTDPERGDLVKYMCVSAIVIALFSKVSGGRARSKGP